MSRWLSGQLIINATSRPFISMSGRPTRCEPFPVGLNQIGALDFCFDRIFCAEPVTTSAENALRSRSAPTPASSAEDVLKDAILQRIWRLLAIAANQRSPFTFMQLATVDENNAPKLRTIVVRSFDENAGTLAFVTDIRSRKVAEIRANPLVALTAFDSDAGVQLRMDGRAEIIVDPTERRHAWEALRPHTHILFRSSFAPGTPLSSPRDAQLAPGAGIHETLDPFEQFALVQIVLKGLDWLDISSVPHKRCRFVEQEAGWSSDWIVP